MPRLVKMFSFVVRNQPVHVRNICAVHFPGWLALGLLLLGVAACDSNGMTTADMAVPGDGGRGGPGDMTSAPACAQPPVSGMKDIDIPKASITGKITVAGNTTQSAYGRLYLRALQNSDQVYLGKTGSASYTQLIVPGTYDILYRWDASDPAPTQLVPRNSNALLRSGVALMASQTLDIDIPTATVNGQITVGGGTVASTYGMIYLRNTQSGDTVYLGRSGGMLYSRLIVPGTYDIYYQWDASDPAPTQLVPRNGNAVLRSGVTLLASQKLDIDIPIATINGQITVGGSMVNSTYGMVYLRNTQNGDNVFLGRTGNLPYARLIVPGTYDILYRWDASDPAPTQLVPRNGSAVLRSGVALMASQKLDIDIPTATVNGQITVGGSMVASTYGMVYLRNPQSGDSVYLGRSGNMPYARLIVPGTYNIHYSWDASDPAPTQLVPRNGNAALRSGLALMASQKLDIDVPTATIKGQITVNGAVTNSTYGKIYLRSPQTNENFFLGRTGNNPYSLLIVPGIYDVFYAWDASDPAPTELVPHNSNARLSVGVDLRTSKTVNLDLPATQLAGNLTVGGMTTMSTYGQVYLENTPTADGVFLGRTGNTPYHRLLMPGAYDVFYRWDASDPAPTQLVPRNSNAKLGCVNIK